jgi:hypothetical protein
VIDFDDIDVGGYDKLLGWIYCLTDLGDSFEPPSERLVGEQKRYDLLRH